MNPKNSNPKFTGERHIFHYTFLFDAYAVSAGAEAPVGADASDDGKPETSAVKL